MKKKTNSTGKTARSNPIEEHPSKSVIDHLAGFSLRFERFSRDVIGILLIVAALATLFGATGLSEGSFITPWSDFLRLWLGWGIFPTILFIFYIGATTLSRKPDSSPKQQLVKILAIEGWIFSFMGVLAVAGGHLIERAEAGLDGGVIGWGLVRMFGDRIPIQFIAMIFIAFMAYFTIVILDGIKRFQQFVTQLSRIVGRKPSERNLPKRQTVGSQRDLKTLPTGMREDQIGIRPRPDGQVKETHTRDKQLPPLNLLTNEELARPDREDIHQTAELIEKTLEEFGVPARVTGYRVGPTVTQFAVEPGYIEKSDSNGEVSRHKVRVSQISGLARDLALRLSAQRLRIEAPVAGQTFVGIEVPNDRNSMVRLRALLESPQFLSGKSPLTVALGKDVSGMPVIGDLATMPHLLIAGTTGSGKSICIQSITMSLVMNNTPKELKLAMLDPKMVELARFNGIPHLLGEVETKPERMIAVLSWALVEMGERYRLLEMNNARDLESYNRKATRKGESPLPRIVIVIDELADLMMSMPEQTEHTLVRLAQMARATGIHLVVATQRPSTNVITGLIKANFPTRISFSVASSVDSRVILDTTGAETLLGHGDLLFLNPEVGTPIRAQGVYVTDREVERVVNFWIKLDEQQKTATPWEDIIDRLTDEAGEDALLSRSIDIIKQTQKASASLLQRRLHIGYPRAARIIDQLESMGLVGPSQPGGRDREVLIDPDDDLKPIEFKDE